MGASDLTFGLWATCGSQPVFEVFVPIFAEHGVARLRLFAYRLTKSLSRLVGAADLNAWVVCCSRAISSSRERLARR